MKNYLARCNFIFQLRGAQILDAVRLHKNGFPESIGYSEFWRKFHLLAAADGERDGATKATMKKTAAPALGEMRGAVEKLLVALEIDRSAVRMGNTQVGTIEDKIHLKPVLICLLYIDRWIEHGAGVFSLWEENEAPPHLS